jgi:hypothetical protein
MNEGQQSIMHLSEVALSTQQRVAKFAFRWETAQNTPLASQQIKRQRAFSIRLAIDVEDQRRSR